MYAAAAGGSVSRYRVTSNGGSGGTPTYRNPWDQAYAATSFWNQGIGTGAQWSAAGSTLTNAANAGDWTWNTGNSSSGWISPMWIGASSGCVPFSANVSATGPSCKITNYGPWNCPTNAYVAPGNGPGGWSDSWFVLFGGSSNPKYAFCSDNSTSSFSNNLSISGSSATISTYYGSVWDVTSNGLYTPTWSGWNASNNCTTGIEDYGVGGTLRTYDINRAKAGLPIQHGFRLALNTSQVTNSVRYTGACWPVWNEDWSGYKVYSGSILFGSTIGIPSVAQGGPNFATMSGISAPGIALCQAVQNYGAFVHDTSSGASLPCDQTVDTSWVSQANSDFNNFVVSKGWLRVMTNQAQWTNNSTGVSYTGSVNGGGTYPYTQIPDFYPSLGIGNGRTATY